MWATPTDGEVLEADWKQTEDTYKGRWSSRCLYDQSFNYMHGIKGLREGGGIVNHCGYKRHHRRLSEPRWRGAAKVETKSPSWSNIY